MQRANSCLPAGSMRPNDLPEWQVTTPAQPNCAQHVAHLSPLTGSHAGSFSGAYDVHYQAFGVDHLIILPAQTMFCIRIPKRCGGNAESVLTTGSKSWLRDVPLHRVHLPTTCSRWSKRPGRPINSSNTLKNRHHDIRSPN